jgi:phosphoglycerate dehydrogenase-like enzyme
LVHALEAGWIRGAALDVTDPEPLPPEHRLWEAPNLFITPHVSWKTSGYWGRVLDILDVNLQRLAEGRPLMNTVEKNKPA